MSTSIEDFIKCPICMEIINNLCDLDCGHSFCKNCIELWLKNKKTCPICTKKPKKLKKPNYIAKSIIDWYVLKNNIKREEPQPLPKKKKNEKKKRKVESLPLDKYCDECFEKMLLMSQDLGDTDKVFEKLDKNCRNNECSNYNYTRNEITSSNYNSTRNENTLFRLREPTFIIQPSIFCSICKKLKFLADPNEPLCASCKILFLKNPFFIRE